MDQTMETFVIHPFHQHGLILRELSDRTKLECFICGETDVHGWIYCCEDCDIFIHSECLNLPLQLHHPFHPDHPIKLLLGDATGSCGICGKRIDTTTSYRYRCEGDAIRCTYYTSVCVRCVTLTLPLNDEVFEVPDHLPQHNHPLTLFNVTLYNSIQCRVCREAISGLVYGCRICLFAMHESCAQLPKKMMKHLFHPHHPLTFLYSEKELGRCRACGDSSGTNYRYCCESSECQDFNLHAHCATRTLPPPDWKQETLISSAIHPHPLLSFPLTCILCTVCRQILEHDDEVYCCLDCIVPTHKKCAEIPQQLTHPMHPKHPLALLPSLPTDHRRCCGHCTSLIYDDFKFVFNCKCCEFYLCIDCALRFLADGDKVMSLDFQHLVHEHPLTRRPSHGDATAGEFCKVCNNREADDKSSLLYGCNTCDGFSIHESCVKEVSEILNHPFHPSHSLQRITFDEEDEEEYGNERCSGCFSEIWSGSYDFFFHCAQCSFSLCYDCAYNEYPTINHRPHIHELSYFTKIDLSMKLVCNYCGITCTADLYRCVDCNFSLHHDCATLPLTAIDEYHDDPLYLSAGAPGDYADSKEFNCSHCERSRDPKLGIYACEPCHYYVHIHCMVPKERGKRKKITDTVCQKWDAKISIKEARLEELYQEMSNVQEELESLKIEKEQEIEDLAIRDYIDEL